VGEFNNPLSPIINTSPQQNITKEILDLNHSIDQMDLADAYRICNPTSAHYTFFSAAHGTFSKTDQNSGHKASVSKYKKIEIFPSILSDHNALKLELNSSNNVKPQKICKQLEAEQHIAQ
jgi:hypothetical protein